MKSYWPYRDDRDRCMRCQRIITYWIGRPVCDRCLMWEIDHLRIMNGKAPRYHETVRDAAL